MEHSVARYFLRSSLEVSIFLGMVLEVAREGFGAGDNEAIADTGGEVKR